MPTAIQQSFNIRNELKDFRIGSLDGFSVYLRVPSFDCDWYWGFGYLGNANIHFHLDGLHHIDQKVANMHLRDQLKSVFGNTLTIPDDKLWAFCEIVQTIYTLRKAANVFYLGGSHTSTNPDKNVLKNDGYCNTINGELIPMQIRSLWRLLTDNGNSV